MRGTTIIFISAIRHFLTDTRLHTDYSKVHILCPSSRLGLDSSDLPRARLLRGSRRRRRRLLLSVFRLSRCKRVEIEPGLAPTATDCPRGLLGNCVQVRQVDGDHPGVWSTNHRAASKTSLVPTAHLVLNQVVGDLVAERLV